jgi:hypothetical protein
MARKKASPVAVLRDALALQAKAPQRLTEKAGKAGKN